ncbi:MAG: PAS domain-containing protein [Prevotellaceae bacterium]|jgi:signal transduction histidine kinase|nr:PAS domain-containing protein [Prevotellaceae bacterium]
MNHKRYIAVLFTLTIVAGAAAGYGYAGGYTTAGLLLTAATLSLSVYVAGIVNKFYRDVENFAEAARYRDFSKQYAERTGWQSNKLYRYFNDISRVFSSLSREKEIQQQYLRTMMEEIDTGILAYDKDTGDILWMNDAFKTMFGIPEINHIAWLQTRRELLYRELAGIPAGQNRLITVTIKNHAVRTLVNVRLFRTSDKTCRMIAFHNISATMEEIEANAWKGLLSVMTHEIMNSIAPVASLADTLKKRMNDLRRREQTETPTHEMEDIALAMDTIHRRSEGLLRFADNYRNLSQTVVPDFRPTNIPEMLYAIYRLMQPSLQQKKIILEIRADHPRLTAPFDRNLIEQVLINFITNAATAVREKDAPCIVLSAGMAGDTHTYITVADNGCGISPDVRDKMFIPFFSTKKNGTGIGLSLSREIVKLHNGKLYVQSKENAGSAFTILIPAAREA